MGEMTDIRDRLKRSREVKIWFWDGVREFTGTALELTPDRLTGTIKIHTDGEQTEVPGVAVIAMLIKHLQNRNVDMNIQASGREMSIKSTILTVEENPDDGRRVRLEARLNPSTDQARNTLEQLSRNMSSP